MTKQQKHDDATRRDTQIGDFAQFIDVLDAIASLKSITAVRKDIEMRKRLLNEDIELMKSKNVEN